MKNKITILFITILILAFSTQAQAQTKDAVIVGAKTATEDDPNYNVQFLEVQTNSNLLDPIDWDAVEGDFFVMDPNTSTWFGVDSLNSGNTTGDQYFRVYIDENTHSYGPGETGLKFKYTKVSADTIPTENGNLQPTFSNIDVSDGILPVIYADSLFAESNHVSGTFDNPTLATDGDSVYVEFVTSEAIA